jgi:LPS-assembly lipoprotein
MSATHKSCLWALLLPAALATAGCGYQLAGSAPLPAGMARTYVETSNPSSEFLASLREALRLRGMVIVEERSAASARIIISDDTTGQRVLSVSARNIPREYEIFYSVTFELETDSGRLIEPASLLATRSYTFNETQVLAKSREERILRRSLADDLARQVVRRIEAAAAGG